MTAAVRIALPPGPDLDPYALAGPTGAVLVAEDRVLVGLGTARTVVLPAGPGAAGAADAVVAGLAGLACVDHLAGEAGSHPVVALGSLPFAPHDAGGLVVPRVLYCREPDGRRWVTVAGDDPAALPGPDDAAAVRRRLDRRAARRTAPAGAAGPVEVVPRSSDEAFAAAVATVVAAVRRGELAKAVLARSADVLVPGGVDVPGLLRRWHRLEPACTLFSLPTTGGQFVGASPELLIARSGREVRSRPLAGTAGRDGAGAHGRAPLPPELLASAKDAEEHRLVVEAIRAALAPACEALVVPDEPELVHLHNLVHLGTTVRGTLAVPAHGPVPSALALVGALHPTPAVGGVPLDSALRLIARLEPDGRGPYAGPVGWIDAAGDGRFVVGIRAMTVGDASVRLTAGVGVVAGSRPETELAEADLKFRAVFDALAPGAAFSTAPLPADGRRAAV